MDRAVDGCFKTQALNGTFLSMWQFQSVHPELRPFTGSIHLNTQITNHGDFNDALAFVVAPSAGQRCNLTFKM